MRLFPESLRWRLSAVIAVVSALAAVALSLLVRTEFSRIQLADARRVQDERIQLVVRDYGVSGQAALGSELDSPKVPAALRAAVRGGKRATMLERDARGAWIWAAAETGGKVLSLRSSYRDRDEALDRLDSVLIIGSAGVLVLGSVLGVVLGGRLSRRLRRAAVAAREVAEGPVGTATGSVGDTIGDRPRDETTELAQAVDAMAEALHERLAAEQRVTADIAHELRTPVTGLVTAAELLPPSRPAEFGIGSGRCGRWSRTFSRSRGWTRRVSGLRWRMWLLVTSCVAGRWRLVLLPRFALSRSGWFVLIRGGWSGCW